MVTGIEVEQFEIDGVKTFFVAADGPTVAGLSFRVGQADESLSTRGITHLVEHLALHAVGQTHSEMNGMVAQTETSFVVRGSTKDVASFFNGVTRSLRDLPLERLDAERRIMAVESSHKRASVDASLLVNRFGAQGYGLAAMPELGVKRLTGEEVQAWARQWMTTANAALWIVGAVPDGLKLAMPSGRMIPAPQPAPLASRLPAWYADQGAIMAIDAIRPRSDALQIALAIARARIENRLRVQDASTYAVVSNVEIWTEEATRAFMAADSIPDQAGTAVARFLATVGELAVEGPSPEELTRTLRDATSAWSGPQVAGRYAVVHATNHLHQRRTRDRERFLADLAAVTAEDVATEIEAIRTGALVATPARTSVADRRYWAISNWSLTRVRGRELVRTTWLDEKGAANRLIVGPQGVTFLADEERTVTITFSETVAVQRRDDGARTVFGANGFRIFVHPEEWVDGRSAVETIDRIVDDGLVIPTGAAAGSRLLDEASRRAQASGAPAAQASSADSLGRSATSLATTSSRRSGSVTTDNCASMVRHSPRSNRARQRGTSGTPETGRTATDRSSGRRPGLAMTAHEPVPAVPPGAGERVPWRDGTHGPRESGLLGRFGAEGGK